MIKYSTVINIPEPPFKITYNDKMMFLGSCFAENIGSKMSEYLFQADINPFGVLYNPLSVSSGCWRLRHTLPFQQQELFYHNGMYNSFSHHSKFSNPSAEKALEGMNKALFSGSESLKSVSYLMITFGTAYLYRLKSTGAIVANCHKMPGNHFTRERMAIEDITQEWSALFNELWRMNPSLKIVLTVSPIRHWKDGAHYNQVSKSILLLAEQFLSEQYPGKVSYFPAYELMMDELRDYRFYAEDMLHPSSVAVNYIWERFCEAYIDKETQGAMKEVEKVNKKLNHRPFFEKDKAYKEFLTQTLLTINLLQEKNPYICLSKKKKEIIDKLEGLRQ